MNIKQLAIKNNSSSVEPKEAHIDFVGEGVVKASDIQAVSYTHLNKRTDSADWLYVKGRRNLIKFE